MNAARILIEEYRKARAVPFAWNGRDDCLGFAANVAERIVGHDVIGDLRGRYSTPLGAKRVMASEGWADMGDVAAAFFGRIISLAEARTGDWAHVVNEDGSDTIGVFSGAMIAAKTEAGMGQVPRSLAVRAFRIE